MKPRAIKRIMHMTGYGMLNPVKLREHPDAVNLLPEEVRATWSAVMIGLQETGSAGQALERETLVNYGLGFLEALYKIGLLRVSDMTELTEALIERRRNA